MIAGFTRDQLVGRFEDWLDNALAQEDPPEGLSVEILSALANGETQDQAMQDQATQNETSSYALWSAMTALTQEVKLEGRAFRELSANIDSQPAKIVDEMRAVYRDRERDVQREAERRCRKEILGSLLDLRDRLERGVLSARQSAAQIAAASRPGGFARLVTRLLVGVSAERGNNLSEAPIAAVMRGYELGLERLDQMLEDFNARPIDALGQPFDPRRMNAIERQASDTVPEGTVLEVYRTGYEWNGEVFRPSQVKVSVTPTDANKNE